MHVWTVKVSTESTLAVVDEAFMVFKEYPTKEAVIAHLNKQAGCQFLAAMLVKFEWPENLGNSYAGCGRAIGDEGYIFIYKEVVL